MSDIDFSSSVVEALRKHFAELADRAESEWWQVLYLDAMDVLEDVLSAWKGEVEP